MNKFSVSQTIEHLFHGHQNTILLRKVSENEVGFEIFLNDNKNWNWYADALVQDCKSEVSRLALPLFVNLIWNTLEKVKYLKNY